MKKRQRKKNFKRENRRVRRGDIEKNRFDIVYSDHKFLRSLGVPERDFNPDVLCLTTVSHRSMKNKGFYDIYGVPYFHTFDADTVICEYLIEMINATVSAGSIIDWEQHEWEIPVYDSEDKKIRTRTVTTLSAVNYITKVLTEYLKEEHINTTDELLMNVKCAFMALGVILPALWW